MTLRHELVIVYLDRFRGHQARCTCGWTGEYKISPLSARIDAKQHRIETATEDDNNTKRDST